MEFLISLAIEEIGTKTKIYFRLFNEQFVMKLKEFSVALGFHKRCILDPSELAKKHRYDRNSWWSAISHEPVSSTNSIVSIHNPTLRFLAKWLAMVVHPRADLRLCSLPDLQYLYAMAKQIHCSPVRTMLAHWQKLISSKSPIDMTFLVTRIARYIGVMKNGEVTYLPETRRHSSTRSVSSILCKGT